MIYSRDPNKDVLLHHHTIAKASSAQLFPSGIYDETMTVFPHPSWTELVSNETTWHIVNTFRVAVQTGSNNLSIRSRTRYRYSLVADANESIAWPETWMHSHWKDQMKMYVDLRLVSKTSLRSRCFCVFLFSLSSWLCIYRAESTSSFRFIWNKNVGRLSWK